MTQLIWASSGLLSRSFFFLLESWAGLCFFVAAWSYESDSHWSLLFICSCRGRSSESDQFQEISQAILNCSLPILMEPHSRMEYFNLKGNWYSFTYNAFRCMSIYVWQWFLWVLICWYMTWDLSTVISTLLLGVKCRKLTWGPLNLYDL